VDWVGRLHNRMGTMGEVATTHMEVVHRMEAHPAARIEQSSALGMRYPLYLYKYDSL
jgi:hypothetical protein